MGSNAKLTKPFDGCRLRLYMAQRTKDSPGAGRLHWRTLIVIKVSLLTSEFVHVSFTCDRQVVPCLQSRCRVGWDKKCMLWYYVLVQKEACKSQFTLRVDEYYFLFRPCSVRE